MLILINSNDLVLMYIALECQSILLYILAASKRYSNLAVEAAAKFYINSAFSSTMMVFGISLIYTQTASTEFAQASILLNFTNNTLALQLGAILLLAGFIFKLALVPMHFWIGEVYQGSYGYFAAYMALITKLPKLIVCIKFVIFF